MGHGAAPTQRFGATFNKRVARSLGAREVEAPIDLVLNSTEAAGGEKGLQNTREGGWGGEFFSSGGGSRFGAKAAKARQTRKRMCGTRFGANGFLRLGASRFGAKRGVFFHQESAAGVQQGRGVSEGATSVWRERIRSIWRVDFLFFYQESAVGVP